MLENVRRKIQTRRTLF